MKIKEIKMRPACRRRLLLRERRGRSFDRTEEKQNE